MWLDIYWYEWVIGALCGVILGMLPHVIWPNHRNPFAWKEGKKPKQIPSLLP